MKLLTRPFIPSGRIDFYTDRVIRDLNLRDPPVFMAPILEYFGIDLHLIDPQLNLEFEEENGVRIEIPALLWRENGKARIFVRDGDRKERQRLSVFHECGHFDLPGHDGFSFACDWHEADIDNHRDVEREAYEYASNIIFPKPVFNDEIMNSAPGLETIGYLARRYRASFEATAIKYVKTSPLQCAIIYFSPNPKFDDTGFPFLVNYSVVSRRFHRYWRKGDGLYHSRLFENCFYTRSHVEDVVPAAIFGSTKSHSYLVEAKRFGQNRFCAFLQIPEKQLRFY